jgi:hypothetical protein
LGFEAVEERLGALLSVESFAGVLPWLLNRLSVGNDGGTAVVVEFGDPGFVADGPTPL